MPTRNINLTPQQDAFVQKVVQSGEYQNASEAIRAALAALQRSRKEEALKLKVLRAEVRKGMAELDAGEFFDVEEGQLESFMESLLPKQAASAKRAEAKATKSAGSAKAKPPSKRTAKR
jgi:antitoxin ParD1/3/4